MDYKTILVPLRTIEGARQTLPVAMSVCRRSGAHRIGLFVYEIPVDLGYAGMIVEVDRISGAQRERANAIKAVFDEMTAGEDILSECRIEEAEPVGAADHILQHARAADLVVMAQANPDHDASNAEYRLDRVIRKAGRPVLVVPYAGTFETIGHSALVGWSPTRESARAAHDAVPLLAPGAKATILTAHGPDGGSEARLSVATAKELARAYDRHGVEATVVERVESGISIGDILLNEAFERGCDLIVTGAFGHSQFYDFVIGAVTTRLLESMTAPVLFSN